jgi:ATP-dependent helicase HrpA
MNVRVVDASGRELGMDRDLAALRARLSDAARLEFAAEGPAFERRGMRQWDFGELPQTLTMRRDGQQRTGYPALVDEPDGVALMLLDTPDVALAATRQGVIRLIGFELSDALSRMLDTARAWTTVALVLRAAVPTDKLQDDLLRAVADRAYIGDDPLPRDRQAFAAQVKRARTRLAAVVESALALLAAIGAEHQALSRRIAALPASQRMLAAEAKAQRDALVYPGFLVATPWARLAHLPRYLQALSRRIERYPQNPERDQRHAAQVGAWWARYRERAEAERRAGGTSPPLDAFRWMLEELRVSLFAQELRTSVPVSLKRVEKAWQALAPRG